MKMNSAEASTSDTDIGKSAPIQLFSIDGAECKDDEATAGNAKEKGAEDPTAPPTIADSIMTKISPSDVESSDDLATTTKNINDDNNINNNINNNNKNNNNRVDRT